MDFGEWLRAAEHQLKSSGVNSARLDALLLLERATGRDRAWLLAHSEEPLNDNQAVQLSGELTRRLVHEPMSYIMGSKEFYGREFFVDSCVLEPRPESESMIDLLKLLAPADASIADIGTGSGALGITAALEIGLPIAATDVDPACLLVAERNALQHNVAVQYFNGDLLEPFMKKNCKFRPDVLLANLPYVPDDYPINLAATHEPKLALFGGQDGLDLYRKMFGQITNLPKRPQLIITEALPQQHKALSAIAQRASYTLKKSQGLAQAFVA